MGAWGTFLTALLVGSLCKKTNALVQWFSKWVPGPAAAGPRSLSAVQVRTFRPHRRPAAPSGLRGILLRLQLGLTALIISNHPHEPHIHCWGTVFWVGLGAGSLPKKKKAGPRDTARTGKAWRRAAVYSCAGCSLHKDTQRSGRGSRG